MIYQWIFQNMIQPLSKLHNHLDISVNKLIRYNHTHVIIFERENNNVLFCLNPDSIINDVAEKAWFYNI
ncbi:hypothetical protein B795N_23420 [Marinilactibacillus psychrotolerans]|nr:hypothetical protein B795N_23420 [Marinilactibacillus psychrotolerans]